LIQATGSAEASPSISYTIRGKPLPNLSIHEVQTWKPKLRFKLDTSYRYRYTLRRAMRESEQIRLVGVIVCAVVVCLLHTIELSAESCSSGLARDFPQVMVFRGGTTAANVHFSELAHVEVVHDGKVGDMLKPVESNYADCVDTIFHTRWASLGSNNADAQDVYPGHWLLNVGARLISSVSAAASSFDVDDVSSFSVNDRVMVYGTTTNLAPNWSFTEEAIITNIAGNTIELDRDEFWTTPLDWNGATQEVRIASHVLIWEAIPDIWAVNLSPESPIDSSVGPDYRGDRFFADHFFTNLWMDRLDGSATNVFINGFEFDGGRSLAAKGANQDRVDIDNNLESDGGFLHGVNLYGLGAIRCMKALRGMLPTGVIVQVDSTTADFGFRGYKYVNGIEMENFPEAAGLDFSAYSDYGARPTAMFSSAFLHLRQWVSVTQQQALTDTNYYAPFSYGFTKEETETFQCGNTPSLDPYGFPTHGHDSYFRLGLAADLLVGMPHPYACEDSSTGTQYFDFYKWDEYVGGDLNDWDWLGQPTGTATQILDHIAGSVTLTNAAWSGNFKNCASGSFSSSTGTHTLTVSAVGTNGAGSCTPAVGQALTIATGSPLAPLITNGLTWADFSAPTSGSTTLPKLYESTLTMSFSAMATNSYAGDGSAEALAFQSEAQSLGDGVPRLLHVRMVLKDNASNQLLPEQILLVPTDGAFHSYLLSYPLEIYEDRFPTLEDIEITKISFFSGEETGSLIIKTPTLQYGSAERWARYFDGGAVLLNGSEDSWQITLEWPYAGAWPPTRSGFGRLSGSQNQTVNSGSNGEGVLYRTFTVPPRDALLVRRLDLPARILKTSVSAGSPFFTWRSYSGETFRVTATTDLVSDSFSNRAVGITATPPTNTWTDGSPGESNLIYRVEM
jgi:hypothetical protein